MDSSLAELPLPTVRLPVQQTASQPSARPVEAASVKDKQSHTEQRPLLVSPEDEQDEELADDLNRMKMGGHRLGEHCLGSSFLQFLRTTAPFAVSTVSADVVSYDSPHLMYVPVKYGNS